MRQSECLVINPNMVYSVGLLLTVFRFIIKEQTNAIKVSKGAKIRNRYNQVPYLTQNTNGKVTKIVSEYDQEIPQSQTADNPVAP